MVTASGNCCREIPCNGEHNCGAGVAVDAIGGAAVVIWGVKLGDGIVTGVVSILGVGESTKLLVAGKLVQEVKINPSKNIQFSLEFSVMASFIISSFGLKALSLKKKIIIIRFNNIKRNKIGTLAFYGLTVS